ncbi:MAG: SprT family zinc-dependent metalloprotease [Methylophaga sp.]|uniref:M48 family metallopeptidase n=1 Tax=Methylophaga sp. TaxID=2024840 RepID=UPI00299CDFC0|nr:SprT family zinc-dependent metalloprotease [Methylophaga sp.]MDX1750142.1 SprT family zinc-dependent metalloprotease [Methylophaga sp.]
MSTIKINDHSVAVVRSARRKTIAIKIQDGNVTVHLPKLMPLWLAKQFVMRKQQWIEDKLKNFQQRPPKRQFIEGELQPFMGEQYPLHIIQEPQRQRLYVRLDQQKLVIMAPPNVTALQVRQALTRWYRRQAESLLSERVKQLAEQTGLRPNQVQIKSYKARWGSCTMRGDIQLNWQLVQATQSINDYVIIHELCHLRQHNHSKAFWDLVEQFDPNFREHRRWLKQHGHQLVI